MQKKLIFSLLTFSFFLASCNVFDPFEPNSNHLDRCKLEADKGNYDNAEEECNKALEEAIDDEDTAMQVAVNTELGDIYLAKSGITIAALSKVFASDANGASPIIALVNSVIENANEGEGTGLDADGNKVKGITTKNIEYAEKAMNAFDTAAATGMYSDFAGLMARVCYITLILAYTDNDGDGGATDKNGKLDSTDICTVANCETVVTGTDKTFCINSDADPSHCGGMSDEYAHKIADMFLTMGDELASLGIKADIGKSTNALVSQTVDLVKCTRTVTSPAECYTYIDTTCDDATEINNMCVPAPAGCLTTGTCVTATEKQTVEWIFNRMGSSLKRIMAGAARKALFDLVSGS